VYIQFQANGMVGAGIFGGVGVQGSAGTTDGRMPSGTETTGYYEANVALGEGSGFGVNFDSSGVTGVSGSVRGFPGTGFGAMAGFGGSTTTTFVSPSFYDFWKSFFGPLGSFGPLGGRKN